MVTKKIIGITLILILFGSGCRLTYLLHAAAGQFRVLRGSIPVEEALNNDYLRPEQKGLLRLVAQIKEFGENELGLKKTQNYQEIYLPPHLYHIYSVSASPKDRLSRVTWWFPVVGKMPYLGFFDLESAREEKENLVKKDLDVTIGISDAYSTLGWFRDPVTMNMIQRSAAYLAETILHEITHSTLYLQGKSEFNEGLAVLVGKRGALHFLEKTHGFSHPLTMQARKAVEDERIFSSFLASLLDELERLYDSPIGYEEKLTRREEVFSMSLEEFARLKNRLQTKHFINFDNVELNNAYLLSIGLYHRNFHLFEAVLNEMGGSIAQMLAFFQGLAKEEGDLMENTRKWLEKQKDVN
jgi:predicted aminopeptidase